VRIYTLGTLNRTEAELSKIISKYQIQVVADIRRSVSSPGHPRREDIQRSCADNKAEYLYLGNELGSNRETGSIRDMDPAFFERGISILRSLARTRGLLILCSELTPEKCNRRVIASELAKDGAEVLHLLELEKSWIPGRSRSAKSRRPRPSRERSYRNQERKHNRKPGQAQGRARSKEPPLKKKTSRSKMDKAL
jgi:uncharacterized protein (DUF488 family)